MTPGEQERQVADNIENGLCPCGDEFAGDCECDGVWRLSVVQGLIQP